MTRVWLAVGAVVLLSLSLRAAEPKPAWEFSATPSPEQAAAPAWLSYSPDGRAIVAVMFRETKSDPPEYTYHLRVWDAATRKERFNAALGTSRSFHFGDDLASFPTDDTVMTGGQTLVSRNLDTGSQSMSMPTGGIADFGVWAVPDLKEWIHIRRDPELFKRPVEFTLRGQFFNQYDEWGGGRRGPWGNGQMQAVLKPPRDDLRTEVLAMNSGRTRIAAAFRDETSPSRPRHLLGLYRIKTAENLELELVADVTNPHPGPVTALAFARNGRILATGGEDGSILLWDLSDGILSKPRTTISGVASHRVYSLAFSNDWRYLAAVSWDKSRPNLHLIDVDTGRPAASIKLERQLTGVAWHPEGHTLLSAGASGMIQAWDVLGLVKGN
jgi:WD40 repeat protein